MPPCLLPLALAGCSTWDLEPQLVRTGLPEMPADAAYDYTPMPGMAHAALPVFDPEQGAFTGNGRVWLKGSAACRRANIAGTTVPLDPPYYTALAEAPPGEVTVEFDLGAGQVRPVRVAVPDPARLNAAGEGFGALFFGDFQPFVVEDGSVRVNPGAPVEGGGLDGPPPRTLLAIREMLRAAATGGMPGFPRPAFVCGVGDQVYVEGDYHDFDRYGHRHPMSAWTIEAQPKPRVGVADLPRFLDTCYRGHWSFTTLELALQAAPSVMIWDDHDIRDGWGSQGDEHVYRDSYFREFRAAFVAHQFRRGPRPWSAALEPIDAPLWHSFAVHGVPVFVVDLRTCRDVSLPAVIGEEQWRVLRQWFAGLDPARSRHYILVSSVPIFYRVAKRANIAADFSEEVRDDLLDTWTSSPNEPEWLQLVAEIDKAAGRGLRGLIISGDYHLNSLCRITASRDGADPTVIAYEMIASGLAAESYGDWKQELGREGSMLETPIELGASSLSTEFGYVDSCPSFGGLTLAGGEVAASIFQATAAGCFELRVPLTWGEAKERLRDEVSRGRRRVELPPGR